MESYRPKLIKPIKDLYKIKLIFKNIKNTLTIIDIDVQGVALFLLE